MTTPLEELARERISLRIAHDGCTECLDKENRIVGEIARYGQALIEATWEHELTQCKEHGAHAISDKACLSDIIRRAREKGTKNANTFPSW